MTTSSTNIILKDGLSIQELEAFRQLPEEDQKKIIEDQLGELSAEERAKILETLKHDIEKIITYAEDNVDEVRQTNNSSLDEAGRQEKKEVLDGLKELIEFAKSLENEIGDIGDEIASRHLDITDGQEGTISPELDGGTYVVETGGTVGGGSVNPFGGDEPVGEVQKQVVHVDVPRGAELQSMVYSNGMITLNFKDKDGNECHVQIATEDPSTLLIDLSGGVTEEFGATVKAGEGPWNEQMQKAFALNGKSFYDWIHGIEGTDAYKKATEGFEAACIAVGLHPSEIQTNAYNDAVKMLLDGKSLNEVVAMWSDPSHDPSYNFDDQQIAAMATVLVTGLKAGGLYDQYVAPYTDDIISLIDTPDAELTAQGMAVLLLLDPANFEKFPKVVAGQCVTSPGWDNATNLQQALDYYKALGGSSSSSRAAAEAIAILLVYFPSGSPRGGGSPSSEEGGDPSPAAGQSVAERRAAQQAGRRS